MSAPRCQRPIAAIIAATLLGGCASTAVRENFDSAQQFTRERLGADVRWLDTDEARRQAQVEVDALLQKPLSADDAVRIALAYSPSLQAMLFEGAASSANAAQSARLPNPVFTFERLVRDESGVRELDIKRMLTIPLLDLLLLPSRLRIAGYEQQQIRLKLTGDIVQTALDARQAWVRAVAAQQSQQYAEQVKRAADASAELARRMQQVGNFSKLQRAREQAFAADAVAQLARAQQTSRSARETLIRALGLSDTQARSLQLPERLPNLPPAPLDEAQAMQTAIDQRLDVSMARAELEFSAREQGLTQITSVINGFHIAGVRISETGEAPKKGYELDIPLPIFDFGDALRTGAQARYMARLNRTAQLAVSASSEVRQSYGAYRTAYDIARHYRDEVVPLRKAIADENVLRYNGMFIGVFELLADAREQIGSVVQAVDAHRDFWLADAALQGAIIGRPMSAVAMEASPSTRAGAPAH